MLTERVAVLLIFFVVFNGPLALAQSVAVDEGRYGRLVSPTLTTIFGSDKEYLSPLRRRPLADGEAYIGHQSGKKYDAVGIEFSSQESRLRYFSNDKKSKLKDFYVITVIDRFADVFIEPEGSGLDLLKSDPDVLAIEQFGQVEAPLPPEVKEDNKASLAVPDPIVRGGLRHSGKLLTGKGVVIAIIDSGVDFRHPDFINYSGGNNTTPTSRIKYLWDIETDFRPGFGTPSPLTFPTGASVGTLYTEQQLTKELRSGTSDIPATDVYGHGTACASIAAGNGNADHKMPKGRKRPGVKGVAPEADIIAVRIGKGGTLTRLYLLNAIVEWLDSTAGSQPLVVSGSFRELYGGRDGQTVQERHLNARFPLSKTGRAIVFAAGNDGERFLHAGFKLGAGERKTVSWNANVAYGPTDISVHFDGADRFEVLGSQSTHVSECMPGKGSSCGNWQYDRITKEWKLHLKVNGGLGEIIIVNANERESEVALFVDQRDSAKFLNVAEVTRTVGSPSTMENAITVGSYDFSNDNRFFPIGARGAGAFSQRGQVITPEAPSSYTSRGLLGPGLRKRRGINTEKPEFIAPGQVFTAAAAPFGTPNQMPGQTLDVTGYYTSMTGTSAAAPYTAGIVALMFEYKPNLTLREVKKFLTDNVCKNPNLQFPNPQFGFGKLALPAVKNIFEAIDGRKGTKC